MKKIIVCDHCGAPGSGPICEYCGCQLVPEQEEPSQSAPTDPEVITGSYHQNTSASKSPKDIKGAAPSESVKKESAQVLYAKSSPVSPKSRMAALLWNFFLGYFGAHYFYAGRFWMGTLYFFTCGFFIVGWIVDFFRILCGTFRDKDGLLVTDWKLQDPGTKNFLIVIGVIFLLFLFISRL